MLNRKIMTRLLETQGYNAKEVADGVDAVRLVKESIDEGQPDRYEVITMDNVLLIALFT